MKRPIGDENPAWLGLAGSVCVVTGAGGGIGAEVARQFARAGASVAVLDMNEDAAASLAGDIRQRGGHAISVGVDVSQPEAVAAAAVQVRRELGPCDALVNNAAVRDGERLLDLSLERWNRVLSINLTGAFICAQTFARQMIETGRGGSMVHVASIMGHVPAFRMAPYSSSKAGLTMLSRVLALELAEYGIRSNSVSPGFVRTPHSEGDYLDADVLRAREQMTLAARISDPVDMANVIAFLASDRSSYINGQDVLVDGGLSQTLMRSVQRPISAHKTEN